MAKPEISSLTHEACISHHIVQLQIDIGRCCVSANETTVHPNNNL